MKSFTRVLFITVLFLSSLGLKASHIPGANISYKCISPLKYEVTLWTVFRCPIANTYMTYLRIHNDCSATNPSNYTSTTTGTTDSQWRMDTIPGLTNIDRTQICNRMIQNSKCNGGTLPGVNVTTYIDTITLPSFCDAWTFSWSSCCRDVTTNLTGTPGIYVDTKMYSKYFPCDNSPYISAQPIPYACANQNISYNLNVVDPDGDSLQFALVAARSAISTPVPYSGTYSAAAPINGANINPNTGVLNFNAPAGNYVCCVQIKSFDRTTGRIKCEMVYDFQVIVINCQNQTPQPPTGGVTNVTGSGTRLDSVTVEVCEGGTMCFDLIFNDQDSLDTLWINQQNATTALPGGNATVTKSGTNPLTVTVCWTAPQGSKGSYPVSVVVDDGACPILATVSQAVNVRVTPGLNVNVGPDTNIACTSTINLTANVSGGTGVYSYQWGGNATGTGPNLNNVGIGTYYVDVTDTNSSACVGTDTIHVLGAPPPIPGFMYNAGCPGSPTAFTDTSSYPNGTIATWEWDMGNDGSVDYTIKNPSHTYSPGGPYPIKLKLTGTNGCKDSLIDTVMIPYIPVADFIIDSVCAGEQTCMIDSSKVTNSSITGWQWVFGDGSPVDTTQNPCHVYTTAGTYNVTLIASSPEGCTNSISKTTVTFDIPTAIADVPNECIYDVVKFTDKSTIPIGSINSWSWDVDGDNIDDYQTQNASHGYPVPGPYNWRLIVGSGIGCSDTATGVVYLHPKPMADFTFQDVCDLNALPLNDNSNISSGAISGWSWKFGDGNTGINQNENHNYAAAGTYNVELIITSDSGCTDTVSKQVEVFPLPQVAYTVDDVCEGVPSQFTENVNIPGNATVQSFIWDYGDGSAKGSGANPSHSYAGYGTYPTWLVIVTSDGCVDSATVTTVVNPNPVVDFSADTLAGCSPLCVNFTNLSTLALGNVALYNWEFGDGEEGSGQDVSHCYTNPLLSVQKHDVKLTATSDKGCVTSATKNSMITVYPLPRANFDYDPIHPTVLTNPIVEFINTTAGGSVFDWDFGDGETGNSVSPRHHYQDTGSYYVFMVTENQWGCSDSIGKMLRVRPEFMIYIPNALTVNGDGINEYWQPKGFGIEEIDLYIYDRWGEKVWEGSGLDAKWDGKVFNSSQAETEVYVYRVEVLTVNNESKVYTGKVTILK